MGEKLTDRQQMLWRLGALAAPVMHAAAGCSLITVGVTDLIYLLLLLGKGNVEDREKKSVWRETAKWSLTALAVAESMQILERVWPEKSEAKWVLMILLLLGLYMRRKGISNVAQGSIVLSWFTAILLGSVILSALPEITLKTAFDTNERAGKIDLDLLLLLLLSGTGMEEINRGNRMKFGLQVFMLSVITTICTSGVLTGRMARSSESPFYEMSRSIRFYGSLKRFESMALLGMILGTFLWLAFVLSSNREKDKNWCAMGAGICGGAIYLSGISSLQPLVLVGIICNEYIIPFIVEVDKIKRYRKYKKSS